MVQQLLTFCSLRFAILHQVLSMNMNTECLLLLKNKIILFLILSFHCWAPEYPRTSGKCHSIIRDIVKESAVHISTLTLETSEDSANKPYPWVTPIYLLSWGIF